MKNVSEFLSKRVGDIISLSTTQTMEDHNNFELEMIIKEVRIYNESHDIFHYTGYIAQPQDCDDITYMVLIRQCDDEYELFLYYLNMEGSVEQAREIVLAEDGEDFIKEFCIDVEFGDKVSPVNWNQKSHGSFHGVEYDDGKDEGIKSICEYQTDDECGDNPHALVDWAGDDNDGWIEMWMGSPISDFEVTIVSGEQL